MKRATKLRWLVGLASQLLVRVNAQNFFNLDFESAQLLAVPPGQFGGYVSVSDAMPGWQVYYGSSNAPLNVVPHNGLNAGTINASILGPNFSSFPIIEGQYMPFLQSGVSGSLNPEGRTVSLSQVGLVPAMAQSLQFKVNGFAATNFGVFLNGQSLPLFSLFSSSSYTLWSAPVNGFTGQVSELRFTVFSPPERIYNNIGVDSFEFLSAAVPEPGTWALLGLGGALFCCAARRRLK